jgi:adhesin transport system membrane fusion protein
LQKIQNLEGGIVAELYVKEGQIVEAGAPLIRLDDTRFVSNAGETEALRLAMQLRVERLSAQVDDRPLNIPDEVLKAAPSQAANERSLYESRRQQLKDEVGGLQEQLVQRQQELREFTSKQGQYRSQLSLQRQEINMSEPLVAQGAVSPVEVLRLKRAEMETRGQLDATTLAIPRAESAIKEVQRKIDETRGKFRSEALTQLNEARTELNKAESTGRALEDRVSRTLVTSPVRGIVKQLLVNTVGGVIQPGSDMVEIVPLDDTLLVEAKIRPQDIAFLHPGQEAVVKFTAYDYTVYGGLKAKLERIGADTITDEDKKTTYYMITLRTDRSHLGTDEKPLLIIPGMVASVDIITGKKSILSYLLKPIIKARAEALHER